MSHPQVRCKESGEAVAGSCRTAQGVTGSANITLNLGKYQRSERCQEKMEMWICFYIQKYCDIRCRIQAYTVFTMSTCKITEIVLCQKFTKTAFLGSWMMKLYRERGYNGIGVLLI